MSIFCNLVLFDKEVSRFRKYTLEDCAVRPIFHLWLLRFVEYFEVWLALINWLGETEFKFKDVLGQIHSLGLFR